MKDKLQDIWNRQYDFDRLAMGNAGVTREEILANRQVALMAELGELFNLTGKKSPTSIGGAMNCPIVFQKTK